MKLKALFLQTRSRITNLYNFLTHEEEIFYFAASLSFYTIFAIIPLLFIILSIISMFPNFQNMMSDFKGAIASILIPTHVDFFTQMLDSFMKQASTMGIVGFVYMGITSLLFFRNYEFITSRMFNSKPRNFLDSLKAYWIMITFFPTVIAFLFYINMQLKRIFQVYKIHLIFINSFSLLLTTILFIVLFRVSANKILVKRILIGSSFVCACIWFIFKWLFLYYISYNKIYPSFYGSISILIIFMLWIYASWTILLFGMRFCEGISIFAEHKTKKGIAK
ncbi:MULTISPECIES: YihY family inner membrane protein [unclassified Helicobacter]|uniref:YihY family inner membrane protein n=1 Tax=unclassified Helicobacter TaxID=2593540 RepID=UPI000CF12AFE|nr:MULTISPECIES: YihY family inner membrane protein [unclassified Helicobacter]